MNINPIQPFSPTEFFSAPLDINTAGKTRSRRPCDSCRRRKSRCELVDGGLPCVLCRFHRQECTFIEEAQPRKRKAGSLTEDDEQHSRDREGHVANDERSGSATRPVLSTPKIRLHQPVDDYANLQGPSLLKKTLGLQNRQHSRLIGSTSEYERSILGMKASLATDGLPVGQSTLRKIDDLDTAFILSPDSGTRNFEDEVTDLDAIETLVAPHGRALIQLYFRIVHPSFPVLHKKVFLEKYERTHREFSPPLLAAVYILALDWWSYSSDLALLPKPDVSELERLAFKTMNDIIHRPKLSTIQAGLLLLQRPEGDSWALTTQLVGLGQDMGLHLDCTRWRIPPWERGLRKRLAWSLFMQDKWGSLVHGRPSHITTSDWVVKPLMEDDFPENAADEDDEDGSAEVEKGRTIFCEMINLTGILAKTLSTFYTLQAEAEIELHAQDGVRWILEKAKPIQMSLKQWYSSLPLHLRTENIVMRKLSSTGYLHLGYYAVEITLHRRIIRSLSSVDDAPLRSICRQAAHARLKSAMDFVQSLRPEHLQSFWYSASKYCFALVGTFISLLWATALDKEEVSMYKTKLDEYRWLLRLSSKSADFLQRALGMLAASTGVLVKVIPAEPNPDAILNRRGISTNHIPFPASHTQSEDLAEVNAGMAFESSESEFQEDTSPEHVGGETPRSSGAGSIVWTSDSFWYAGTSGTGEQIAVDGVFDEELGGSLVDSYFEMPQLGGR